MMIKLRFKNEVVEGGTNVEQAEPYKYASKALAKVRSGLRVTSSVDT